MQHGYQASLQRVGSILLSWVLLCLSTIGVAQTQETDTKWTEVALASGQFAKTPPASWVVPVTELPNAMNAPMYFRMFDTQYRFAVKTGTDRYIRLLIDGNNSAQVHQQCKQTLSFNPKYQTLALHTVGLWRTGHLVNQLDKVVPRFLTSDNGQSSIYTGQVSVLLEIPDCRPGDSIDLAWTVSGHNPVFGPYSYALEQMGWGGAAIGLRNLSFMAPVAEHLHVDTVAHADASKSRLGRSIVRSEEVRQGWQRVRLQDTAVPAQLYDDNGAQGYTQSDLITASTFADWAELRHWAAELFVLPKPPSSAPYKALVQEVNRQPTDQERVAYALQWVQREIRYVSVSLGENAYRPASPDEVLERRYGDCKDVALLLTSVLGEVGVQVQPALMTLSNGRIAPRLNAVPWFDHAVAVAWLNGRPYVLDGTVPLQPSRLERMGVWHALKQVMVVAGPKQGFLTVPPASDLADRTMRRNETMQLDANGRSGRLTINVVLQGLAAERQRQLVRTTPRERVLAQVLKELRQQYPNAQWEGTPAYQDDEQENRIEMGAVFKVPDVLKRKPGGGYRYAFSSNEVTDRLSAADDAQRKVPLGLQSGIQHVVFTHLLQLPQGWRVDEALYDEKIEAPAFIVHAQRTRPAPNSMMDSMELDMRTDTVETEQMGAYQAALRQVLDLETSYKVKQP